MRCISQEKMGVELLFLHRPSRDVLAEQRPGSSEGERHLGLWGKRVPGKGKSEDKGREVGTV